METPVNYLRPRRGELADGEFVARVVENAQCGILLDLHNIWTNERNGRQTARRFLDEIPLERVWEIHVGGGFEHEGFWLDAHSGGVPEPVLALAEEVVPRLSNLGAIVFEIFPSFLPLFGLDAVAHQLERLASLWRRRAMHGPAVAYGVTRAAAAPRRDVDGGLMAESWEEMLGALVTGGDADGALAEELAADPGVELVRDLARTFRAGAVVKALGALTKLLLVGCGRTGFERLLDDYFARTKPQPFASDEAFGFIRYVESQDLDVPYLDEILRYEEASLHAALMQRTQVVRFRHDPVALLRELAGGRLPAAVAHGSYELEIPPELA